MRHYHFLSVPHAIRKYALKHYDLAEVQKGWHDWRPTLRPHMIKLPSQAEMNTYVSDDQLDVSNPRTGHCFFDVACGRNRTATATAVADISVRGDDQFAGLAIAQSLRADLSIAIAHLCTNS